MPDDKNKERKPDIDHGDSTDLEERVRLMMDPAADDEPDSKKQPVDDVTSAQEAATAPEVPSLPVPKEPLKIKILRDGEDADAPAEKIPVKTATQNSEAPAESETPPEGADPEPEVEDKTEASEAADETVIPPEPVNDDPGTEKAVDDIIKHESDELLAAEDEKLADAFRPSEKRTFGQKLKHFFATALRSSKARWAIGLSLFLIATGVGAVPTSRYYVLNTVGVRASMSLQVLDESTQQPLKNVKVNLGSVSGLTDTEGNVKLEHIRLGPSQLKIEKRAFAPTTRDVVIGWGSNPLNEVQLKPVGTQYAFTVTDYLSGKGVAKVEAVSGEASALSDENGRIKLTMDQPPDQIEVTILGDGYRVEKLTIGADSKDEHPVQLVTTRKHVFISKRSGKFDVYKVDIDGKNEEKVLAGTGSEREDMVLIPHPSKEIVALVSTRDGKRDADGYLLSTLTVIDLSSNEAKEVATSERVQLVDWMGDRIIYVQIAAGESAASPKRHRLMSYDFRNGDNRELAASNYFNDVMIAAGGLYYAPSSTYQPQGVDTNVYRSDGDGTTKQIILNKEAWNLFRTAYDHIAISVPGEWYDYRLGSSASPTKLSGEPANLTSRVYVDSPDGNKSLWVDNRDGKGVLLVYEPSSQKEDVLRTQSGLKNPIRWLDNKSVVFRIKTDQETADYAMSLDGGDPKKIRDVTNTGGVDQWYYY